MFKPKVYLDSSVPSAYYDDRAPERQELTKRFWEGRLPELEPVISTVVEDEIRNTPDAEKRAKLEALVRDFDVLELDQEADDLAQQYIEKGIFSRDDQADADHVAIAVVNGVGYLGSWNFGHLVRVRTRREVNLVNALRGYNPIEIVAPPEL